MPPFLRSCFPLLFVLIWSTGFIVARYGMPHAEPMTFLLMRFVGVLIVLVPVSLWFHAPWPDRALTWRIALAGLLLQAGYLGGVWAAVREGMTAGLIALIVGLQPIITACLSTLVQERVRPLQWVGLVLGLAGVALVVSTKISLLGLSWQSLALAGLALASITAGTLYQKARCPHFDLRTGGVIQFGASALICLPFVLFLETRVVDWHPEMIGALIWSVFALSIGAISLLFVMIREGAATKVTSLLYLTPPTTAVMAHILFDEPITALTAAGIALTMLGVWLASHAVTQARYASP